MKLTIILEELAGPPVFHPKDQVRGRLEIRAAEFKLPARVVAVFRGRIKASYLRTDPDNCLGRATCTLFKESKSVELGSGEYEEDGAGDATSQRVYWVPFTFTFPPSCQSCMRSRSATLCQLPPSLDITASGIRAKSEYAIIATVKYHRLWWRTTTTTKELSLSPIPPITLLPTSCIASLPANKLLVPNGEADDLFAEVDPAWLPAYSPTLHLTMLLPQPPVLTRAQATPVQLVLQAPPELLRGEGLYLRNVMLHLRSTMMVRVGAFRQRSVGTSHVWSSRGLVRVDNTRFELNPGDWAVCAGRGMKPSFRSCALGLTYSLEVVAGLSRGTSGPVEYAQASLDVIVMDPPPAYEEV